MYIFYPGEYILGSLLFLLTLVVLKRDLNRLRTLQVLNSDDSKAENDARQAQMVSSSAAAVASSPSASPKPYGVDEDVDEDDDLESAPLIK